MHLTTQEAHTIIYTVITSPPSRETNTKITKLKHAYTTHTNNYWVTTVTKLRLNRFVIIARTLPNTFRVTSWFWSWLLISWCRRIGIIVRASVDYCRWWVTSRYIHHITFGSVNVTLSELILVAFPNTAIRQPNIVWHRAWHSCNGPCQPSISTTSILYINMISDLKLSTFRMFIMVLFLHLLLRDYFLYLFLSAEGFNRSSFDLKFLPNNSSAGAILVVDWGVIL